MPVGVVFKVGLVMPHLYEGADSAFSFAVSLVSIDLGEFLADTVCFAGFNKSMTVSAFIFFAIIRINVIDLTRALGEDYFPAGRMDVLLPTPVQMHLRWLIYWAHGCCRFWMGSGAMRT
ncbi:hypothetical protein SAMN05421755_103134 [Nitrosomonas sp. Nm33]|nr:hypothetical protein SAMN05421755_103134 [Nitrosomonas sp. Nm33]